MAYLAPNPATFDHSDFGYVAQNPATFDHTIVVSTITVSSSSVIVLGSNAVGTNSISLVDVSPVAQGFILPVTASTINLTSTPVIELGNNEGGRIALLAVSNFDPPQGDQIVLQSTTGHWIHAREPKATVASTVELTGAAVIINEPAPDIPITAELSGSVVYVTNDIPVVSSTVVLTGAAIVMVDAAPLVSVSADIVRSLNLLATFNAPTLLASISGAQNECLLNKTLPAFDFAGTIYPSYGLNLQATLPRFTFNSGYVAEQSLGLNSVFNQPELVALGYDNTQFSLSAIVPIARASMAISSGNLLNLSETVPYALSTISFSEVDTLSLNLFITPPTMVASVNEGFNLSAVIPGFTLEMNNNAALGLDVSFLAPIAVMGIDAGYNINTLFNSPLLSASITQDILASNNTLPKLVFEGLIAGGYDNSLNAVIPKFSVSMSIVGANSYSLSSVLDTFSFKADITAKNSFILNSAFIQPTISGLIDSGLRLNQPFAAPILESYIGNAPIEFI